MYFPIHALILQDTNQKKNRNTLNFFTKNCCLLQHRQTDADHSHDTWRWRACTDGNSHAISRNLSSFRIVKYGGLRRDNGNSLWTVFNSDKCQMSISPLVFLVQLFWFCDFPLLFLIAALFLTVCSFILGAHHTHILGNQAKRIQHVGFPSSSRLYELTITVRTHHTRQEYLIRLEIRAITVMVV